MSTNEFRDIALADLLPHPHNPRTDLGDPQKLSELANDLAANGNRTALRVFPITEGEDKGKYLTIAGHRRRAAADLGNVLTLFCEIDPSLDTLPKQLEEMLRENTHREPISAVNEAVAIQTMMTFDEYSSVAKIAKAINRSQATVRKRLLLNKLGDEAKTRIEDNTLNIDQALVLVNFTDDAEVTERLIKAAASPRDWEYTVTAETRRREAPAKVAALEKELEEAGAKYMDDKDLYRWNRLYDNSETTTTIAEHVAAGRHVRINKEWARLEWYEKPTSNAAKKPELTEEQKEEKRREAQLSAALEIAHAVRAEHLKARVLAPQQDDARQAILSLLKDEIHSYRATLAEITGSKYTDADGDGSLFIALENLTLDQLVMAYHLGRKSREEDLLKLWAWDAGDFRHRYGPKEWIQTLGSLYGYQLSSVEQEVLNHFAAAEEARLAENAAEDAAADEEDSADND